MNQYILAAHQNGKISLINALGGPGLGGAGHNFMYNQPYFNVDRKKHQQKIQNTFGQDYMALLGAKRTSTISSARTHIWLASPARQTMRIYEYIFHIHDHTVSWFFLCNIVSRTVHFCPMAQRLKFMASSCSVCSAPVEGRYLTQVKKLLKLSMTWIQEDMVTQVIAPCFKRSQKTLPKK